MADHHSDLDEFLTRRTRYAMLTTLRKDGSPTTVPIWYDWDGTVVSFFCGTTSIKLTRIARDPRVTLLVSNDVDEPEYWVAFDGIAEVSEASGLTLAEQLAPEYWDLDDPQRAGALATWRAAGAEAFRLVTVEPAAIRTYA
ncbi:MAG: pyridoxamine 5'-phosphate oxidase family protein [Actinomycetota bacterium]